MLCSKKGRDYIEDEGVFFIGDSDLDYWGQTSDTYWSTFPNSSSVAIGGNTCDGVLNDGDGLDNLLAAFNPGTVILVCGENDLWDLSVSKTFKNVSE